MNKTVEYLYNPRVKVNKHTENCIKMRKPGLNAANR